MNRIAELFEELEWTFAMTAISADDEAILMDQLGNDVVHAARAEYMRKIAAIAHSASNQLNDLHDLMIAMEESGVLVH